METSAQGVPVSGCSSDEPTMGLAGYDMATDPAELVARIASERRSRLLRIYRRRLRWEDLEDCYSQATLELVARSRRSPFDSPAHLLNALEQKFLSRIEDRRRAIAGRSAIESAMARALPVDSPEYGVGDLEDRTAAVEQQVIARTELRRLREVIGDLSRDQQLVLASQVCVDMGVSEFCARYGWSVEKYRKVAQRARGKLRVLVEEYECGERCGRLEPDVLAMRAGVAGEEALARARAHVANCQPCARMAADLNRAARSVSALLPFPGAAVAAKLSGIWAGLRRVLAIARHPLAETGSTGVGAAGGSIASVGALKVGIAVVCVAGAAGGYAVCARLGGLPPAGASRPPAHTIAIHPHSHARAAQESRSTPAGTGSPAAITSAATTASATTVAPPVRHAQRRRVSGIDQVRREFGTSPAHTAAAAGAGPAASTAIPTQAASGSSAGATSTPSPPTKQTRTEFGFER
jgi:DNA-directed RNA polymerase specialized sigma24 family protein